MADKCFAILSSFETTKTDWHISFSSKPYQTHPNVKNDLNRPYQRKFLAIIAIYFLLITEYASYDILIDVRLFHC